MERMKKEMHIWLEWNDGSLETKMSIDGKMAIEYPQAHQMLVDIIKEIDSFEESNRG